MASRSGTPAGQNSRKPPSSTASASPAAPSAYKPPSSTSTPPPAPSPAPPASSGSPVPTARPDLEQLLNVPIRVRVAAAGPDVPERDLEGALFAVDSSFIVLSSPSSAAQGDAANSAEGNTALTKTPSGSEKARTYHLLKTSTLLSVSVLSPTPDPSLPPVSTPLSFSHLAHTPAEVAATVSRALAAQARVGQGVSAEAQALFDALARTLPVRWAGETIVVLDEVVVDKPYGPGNVKGSKGSAERVERVRKMLEGIRSRLGLTTPQPAT